MSQHTKEPLRVAETRATDIVIRNSNQDPVALVYTAGWNKRTIKATAQRLVDCYNACAGIDNPISEIPALRKKVSI